MNKSREEIDKLYFDFILRYSSEEIDICCAYSEENEHMNTPIIEALICIYSLARYLASKKLISVEFVMAAFDKNVEERIKIINEEEIVNISDIRNTNKILPEDRKNIKTAIDEEINNQMANIIDGVNKEMDFNHIFDSADACKGTIYALYKLNYLNTYEIIPTYTLWGELNAISNKRDAEPAEPTEHTEQVEQMQFSQKCPLCNDWLLISDEVIKYDGQIKEFSGFLIHEKCRV